MTLDVYQDSDQWKPLASIPGITEPQFKRKLTKEDNIVVSLLKKVDNLHH